MMGEKISVDFYTTVVACLGVIFNTIGFFPSTLGSQLIRLISQMCPSVVMGAVKRRTAPADFQPSDSDGVQAGTGGVHDKAQIWEVRGSTRGHRLRNHITASQN